jgi:hypothetical protein
MMAERILTNWPRSSGEFKVVQMEVDGQPFIIFGSTDTFHTLMIKEIGERLNREMPTVKDRSGGEIPALEGEWYRVWGAGKALANKEKRELIFYGRSKAYDIGISKEHLERISAMKPAWKVRAGD